MIGALSGVPGRSPATASTSSYSTSSGTSSAAARSSVSTPPAVTSVSARSSTVTADLVTELIVTGEPDPALAPFTPDRFGKERTWN